MGKKRLQVEMTPDAYERLSEAAERQGTTLAEFVRRAINIDLFLQRQATEDGTVTVEGRDGKKEVLVS